MRTILLATLALLFTVHSEATTPKKRGLYSLTTDFGLASANSWGSSSINVPLQAYSTSGIESFLPFDGGNPVSIDLGSNSNSLSSNANILGSNAKVLPVPVLSSNSIEKPVQEQTLEYGPPQLSGPAVIPYQPPPAVPVIAAAANVPANTGAVFLGAGSLGVVNLGGGAYALGSGGIGYSDIRRQPRPSGTSPLYPPLQARPNLVPAATPSQTQTAQLPALPSQQFGQSWQFDAYGQQPVGGQNGYAPAGNTGFGEPTLRFRLPKTTTSYATPTIQQVQQQVIQPGQQAMPGFGDPIPQIIDLSQPQAIQQLTAQQLQINTAQQQAQQQAQLRQQQAQLQQQIDQQMQLQTAQLQQQGQLQGQTLKVNY